MAQTEGFVANDGFFDGLGRSPVVRALCKQAAEQVAANARASAPVDSEEYRNSIHVEERGAAYRDTFRVVADADHAMVVEARTGNLARALNGVRV